MTQINTGILSMSEKGLRLEQSFFIWIKAVTDPGLGDYVTR
jgi:hypothetical protein